LKIVNTEDTLIALISKEGSDWMKQKLNKLQNILKMFMPDRFQEADSSVRGYTFDSIRFDLYNRFAEKVFILIFTLYVYSPTLRVMEHLPTYIPIICTGKLQTPSLSRSTTHRGFPMSLRPSRVNLQNMRPWWNPSRIYAIMRKLFSPNICQRSTAASAYSWSSFP
jgi:hypothetical protein